MTLASEDFAEQVAPLRPGLLLHCYRMLGFPHDAEDAVQETLLRGWRGVDQFEGRSSLRMWLYTVATNVCLREIERRGAAAVPVDLGPSADPADGLAAPLTESPLMRREARTSRGGRASRLRRRWRGRGCARRPRRGRTRTRIPP